MEAVALAAEAVLRTEARLETPLAVVVESVVPSTVVDVEAVPRTEAVLETLAKVDAELVDMANVDAAAVVPSRFVVELVVADDRLDALAARVESPSVVVLTSAVLEASAVVEAKTAEVDAVAVSAFNDAASIAVDNSETDAVEVVSDADVAAVVVLRLRSPTATGPSTEEPVIVRNAE